MNLLYPKYKPKKFRQTLAFAWEFLIFAFIFSSVWLTVFFSLNFKAYANRLMYEVGTDFREKFNVPAVLLHTENQADEIIISKIGVRAPIIISKDVATKKILDDLKSGVSLYPGSAKPGSASGKTVILGHSSEHIWHKGNYPTVFNLINELEKGDEITVVFGGKTYVYRVEEKFVKTPKQIQKEIKKDGLYLMSCWPIGTDLKRIVVRATLI